MTLVSAIINRAYRESNLIQLGATASAEQQTEALDRLNTMIAALLGYEVGDQLLDWPIGNDNRQGTTDWSEEKWKYAEPNVRLIVNTASPQTIYLPPEPCDGALLAVIDPRNLLASTPYTLNANTRTIEGATSIVLSAPAPGFNRTWMYRADLADWRIISQVAVSDQMPFPLEFDDFFITRLAMRLNPAYGRSMREETLATLLSMEEKLRARYHQIRDVPADIGATYLTEGHDRLYMQRGLSRGRNSWMT